MGEVKGAGGRKGLGVMKGSGGGKGVGVVKGAGEGKDPGACSGTAIGSVSEAAAICAIGDVIPYETTGGSWAEGEGICPYGKKCIGGPAGSTWPNWVIGVAENDTCLLLCGVVQNPGWP